MDVDHRRRAVYDACRISVLYVLSGAITLELDRGAAMVLRAGDTVIQNGARHRWLNNGTERAWIAAVVLGTGLSTQG